MSEKELHTRCRNQVPRRFGTQETAAMMIPGSDSAGDVSASVASRVNECLVPEEELCSTVAR
jgi:hypothetical protein